MIAKVSSHPPSRTRHSKRKNRKKNKKRSRAQRWLLRWGWVFPVGAILVGGGVLGITYAYSNIPLPKDIDLQEASAQVFDRDGRLIGTFQNEVRRFLIDTTLLPEHIGEAVVAAEDRGFYEHKGVSFKGISRAAWANVTGGKITQGGSTITQQYVKNAVLTPERTLSRKVKEVILAIKLEREYSKEQILGFYLNTIYLGRGAYGIEAAARTYFGKTADQLTVGESAYLAGIIPSPESYQIDRNPGGAEERKDRVLELMEDQGFISSLIASRGKREKLELVPNQYNDLAHQPAAYFMEWLRREYLSDEFGSDLFTSGLRIYTTLDSEMQTFAEDAVASVLTEPSDPQAALVSITPRGEVRAFVGGRDFTNVKKARGFNFAADFGRHAGSALKPFTLLAAIEDGVSPNSRFSGSSPKVITDLACNNGYYEVDNYGGASYGTVTLVQATTNSINTVFAQLIAEIGPEKVADLLEEMGFDDDIEPYCSLALGALDVTPVEMARGYAAIDARGQLPEVMPIRYVEDSSGTCLKEYLPQRDVECDEEAPPVGIQVVNPSSADVTTDVLKHVVEEGTASANVNLDRPAAGKTGTAQGNSDAWFAGYVPQLTTVVWMGYPLEKGPDGKFNTDDDIVPRMGYCSDTELCRPVRGVEVTGGSFPAQIWNSFMTPALASMTAADFPVPTVTPTEILNPPPPATPTPSKSPRPSPTAAPTPSFAPTPSPITTFDPKPFPSASVPPDREDEEDDP